MSDSPRVSVIIPTYNRAALLPRAVNSVLAQTCQDFELLIIDDGSADDTPAVIAAFTDPRIRAFRHDPNRGQSAAINTGIAHARGEYVALLDDDSEFTPNSLADRLTALESASPDVALAYGWIDLVDSATGAVRPHRRWLMEGEEAFEHILKPDVVSHTVTHFVRTSAAREIGGYDERLTFGNDQYFFAKILLNYRIIALPKVVVRCYQSHGYPAMGDLNETNDREKVKFQRLFIQLLSPRLRQQPPKLAALLRLRSLNAMECRLTAISLRSFVSAMKVDPFTTTNIRHALRLVKVFVFYVTPLSRYRDRAKAIQRRLGLRKE